MGLILVSPGLLLVCYVPSVPHKDITPITATPVPPVILFLAHVSKDTLAMAGCVLDAIWGT